MSDTDSFKTVILLDIVIQIHIFLLKMLLGHYLKKLICQNDLVRQTHQNCYLKSAIFNKLLALLLWFVMIYYDFL